MKFLTDLISGILGFFGSLFKPKKEGFFLEYEGDAQPASDSASAAASTPGGTVPTSTDSASAVTAVTAVASEAAAAIAPAAATANSKKSARGSKQAPEAARVAAPVAMASTPSPAPSISFSDIARDPCSGPSVSRRRPGANMAGFLAMAKEVAVSR